MKGPRRRTGLSPIPPSGGGRASGAPRKRPRTAHETVLQGPFRPLQGRNLQIFLSFWGPDLPRRQTGCSPGCAVWPSAGRLSAHPGFQSCSTPPSRSIVPEKALVTLYSGVRRRKAAVGIVTFDQHLKRIFAERGHGTPPTLARYDTVKLAPTVISDPAQRVRRMWTAPGLLDTRVRVFDLMRPPQLERVFPALPGPAFGSRSPRESNDGCTGS